MKTRHFIAACFLACSIFYSHQSKAQGTNALYIAAMPGFPDLPQDTAYEGQSYTFDLFLFNNTNIFINSTITFYLKVDTTTSILLTNPQTAIQPGDSITITLPGYNFSQPQYKMGNNIVVVWPVVNGVSVPVDTFITTVYFVPLNSMGSIDLREPSFRLFPVPAQNTLRFDFEIDKQVEYVRIFTVSGQLVREFPIAKSDQVDICFLDPGVYFLELLADGIPLRRKFVKQ